MRHPVIAGAVLVLAALATACDSDQPLTLDSRTVSIEVQARSALVRVWQVWEVFEDADSDGQPDDPDDVGYFCEPCPAGTTSDPSQCFRPVTNAPFSYSVLVSVIPAGETQEVFLTSFEALVPENFATLPFVNLTRFDETPADLPPPDFPPGTPVPANLGVGRYFEMTAGNREIFECPDTGCVDWTSPYHRLNGNPNPSPGQDGVCPARNLAGTGFGEPRLDDNLTPFLLQLNDGDTVLVRARLADEAPTGVELGPDGLPAIDLLVGVDGVLQTVVPEEAPTGGGPISGATFSFTL